MTGARKSVKIFGCVELAKPQFIYGRDEVFNAQTYLNFLENVFAQMTGQSDYYNNVDVAMIEV